MHEEGSSKNDLPEGWIVKSSRKRPDRVYYFNKITGESTWDCPSLDSKSETLHETTNGKNCNFKRTPDSAFSDQESVHKSIAKKFCSSLSNKLLDSEKKTSSLLKVSQRVKGSDYKENTELIETSAKKPCHSPNQIKSAISETAFKNANILSNENAFSPNKSSEELDITPPISETTEDIEMLDLTEDLKKIEDLPANESSDYFIIIDTNIFIHEMKYMDEIINTPIKNSGLPHIFIPWIVIQELDNLRRKSSKSNNVMNEASMGIKYINDLIKAKHPRIHGQSPKEVKEWAQPFSGCNDDRILECCMSLADKYLIDKVILLTNDINLANKAMICDTIVHDMKSFLKHFHSVNTLNKNDEREDSNIILPSEEETRTRVKGKIVESMTEARRLLKETLIKFIKAEMYDAYGKVWIGFKVDLSTLRGLIVSVLRYWKTVYSLNFSSNDLRRFEFLKTKSSTPDGFFCKEDCLDILIAIENIFVSVSKRWPKLLVPIKNIRNLISIFKKQMKLDQRESEVSQKMLQINLTKREISCKVKKKKNSEGKEIERNEIERKTEDDAEITPTESEAVFNVFQHTWVVINHLCGIVMDFYGIPHNFPYDKPAVFPTELEFSRLMCTLYPNVKQLKSLMSRIAHNNSISTEPSVKFHTRFAHVLKYFVSSLQIQIDPIDTTHFTPIALMKFCKTPSNEEQILIGYKQLETFHAKLEEALAVMMSFKKNINSNAMEVD